MFKLGAETQTRIKLSHVSSYSSDGCVVWFGAAEMNLLHT